MPLANRGEVLGRCAGRAAGVLRQQGQQRRRFPAGWTCRDAARDQRDGSGERFLPSGCSPHEMFLLVAGCSGPVSATNVGARGAHGRFLAGISVSTARPSYLYLCGICTCLVTRDPNVPVRSSWISKMKMRAKDALFLL